MILPKGFVACLITLAVVGILAFALVIQAPRIASAAQVAGEPCRAAANTTSTFLGNGTSTGAITSINSGSTQTLRIHLDDLNSANTIRLRVSGGSVNGQAASGSDSFFTSSIAAGQICGTSGLGQTGDGDAVLAAANDAYIQFSFTAPTLPSGIRSQLVQFQLDGNNDGDFADVQDGTYFLPVAVTPANISVFDPDDEVIPATAASNDTSGAAMVAVVRDAGGIPIVGAADDVVTSLGGLDQCGAAGTCDFNTADGTGDIAPGNLSQACSAVTDGNGQVIPTLYGLGVGGAVTVTFTVRGTPVTASRTLAISSSPTKIEVSGRRSNSATSFIAKSSLRNTQDTASDQDELLIVAVARDAAGNAVGIGDVTFTITGPAAHTVVLQSAPVGEAETVTVTNSGDACTVSGAGTSSCTDAINPARPSSATPSHAAAYIDIDDSQPVGNYTVTASIGGTNTTITGSFTFRMVKAPSTLLLAASTKNVDVGNAAPVTITCKDSDGAPCPSGTTVTISVSTPNLIVQNPTTGTTGAQVSDFRTDDAGTLSAMLIGIAPGATNVVANVGTVVTVSPITVGGVSTSPTPAPGNADSFTTAPAPTGFTATIFNGGTVPQLAAAGAAAGVKSITVTSGGKFLVLVVGAPAFVNAEFNAAYPSGNVPAGTGMILAR